jgi:predicted lipoprotein with Yx(FWY)xxD motif
MKKISLATVAALLAAAALSVAALTAGAATNTSVGLRATTLGKVIVDAKGRTLYLFEKDRNGRSSCSGACAAAWPPATVSGKATVGNGLTAKLLKTIKRSDGSTQLVYNGHPLYRFINDKNKPGATKGQGLNAFGAAWYVVGANGKKIDKS